MKYVRYQIIQLGNCQLLTLDCKQDRCRTSIPILIIFLSARFVKSFFSVSGFDQARDELHWKVIHCMTVISFSWILDIKHYYHYFVKSRHFKINPHCNSLNKYQMQNFWLTSFIYKPRVCQIDPQEVLIIYS